MYLFGYGNFVSTADDIGVTLTEHLSVNAGYQLGSRLTVNVDAKSNRLGLQLTQKGPIVGLEASFQARATCRPMFPRGRVNDGVSVPRQSGG